MSIPPGRNEHLRFFLGVDAAPSEGARSDDGALVIGAAQPKIPPEPVRRGQTPPALSVNPSDWYFDFVYGRRFTAKEKLSARQWSGFIHYLHQRFRFAGIMMDPNGGGIYVKREMIAPRQIINGVETDVTPIGDKVDDPLKVSRGEWIVNLFKRGDPGIELFWPGLAGDEMLNDAAYATMKDDLDQGLIGLTAPIDEWMAAGTPERAEYDTWPVERRWALKCLDALVDQLSKFMVETNDDGTHKLTKRNARIFSTTGKKDFVSAAMMARVQFHIWLRSDAFYAQMDPEDEPGFLGTTW